MTELDILITGFAPFEGRTVNSSWIAAKAIQQQSTAGHLTILELPVIWGAPGKYLESYFSNKNPQIVLAMGEGKEGYFALESIARNQRKQRPDNSGQLPPTAAISATGPDQHLTNAPLERIHERLGEEFPVDISADAGNFLCEETLYTLGQYHQAKRGPVMSLFVHLPPFGTRLRDSSAICDDAMLARFGDRLLSTIVEVYRETADSNASADSKSGQFNGLTASR